MKGTYVTRTCPEIHSRHSCAPVQKSRGIRESLRESIQLFSSKEGSYEHQCNYRYYHDSVLLRHGMVLCEGIQPDGGICNHGNVLDCPGIGGQRIFAHIGHGRQNLHPGAGVCICGRSCRICKVHSGQCILRSILRQGPGGHRHSGHPDS